MDQPAHFKESLTTMSVRPFSIYQDNRIDSFVLMADTNYEWYLNNTATAHDNLKIQRDIITSRKAYQTLRADLKRGCVLPPIVLAVQGIPKNLMSSIQETTYDQQILEAIGEAVSNSTSDRIQIIDGLQRTNALREAREELRAAQEDEIAFLQRRLRVEFWLNIPFNALAYRMLLLNAGQKPMSMRHQLEILSGNLKTDLEDIPDLEIVQTLDHRRRTQPGQFQLSKLSQAFQAWLQGQPNIEIQNVVTEQLLSESAVEVLGAGLEDAEDDEHLSFREFVQWLVKLDLALGQSHTQFLGNETVLQGIAAAFGGASKNPQMEDRVMAAMEHLLAEAQDQPDDPIGVELFDSLRSGIDARRKNVGEATRGLIFRAFQEYIVGSGEKSMNECWQFASSM
jgi:hypothetical protein